MRKKLYTLDSIKNIEQLDREIKHLTQAKSAYVQKALKSSSINENIKAQGFLNESIQKQNSQRGGKALLIDPFEKQTSLGYFNKPTNIGFEMLERMSHAPIIRAIINTRKDQIAEFIHPQADKYSKGFIIRKKTSGLEDGSQSTELSAKEKKEVESLISFLENAGDDSSKWHADSLESFTRKIMEDSLSLDQYAFEVVRYRNGDIAEFYAVDAKSIRIAETFDDDAANDPELREHVIDGYLPSYVQIYQNRIVSEFYPWELAVGIRNPQTDMRQAGYGRSELEDLIQTVTAMLNADSYNANFFKHGSAPKGMMMIKKSGGINNDTLNEFRADWQATMAGVNNFHKTPVLDAEHVEWLDLQKNNKDMEYSDYQQYLIKLTCAIYKISPEEVGFPTQGASNGLGNGSNKDELDYSKEKGLAPLLRNLQRTINKYLIGPKSNDKYEFHFVGVSIESEQEEDERLLKAVGGPFMEINEARERKGMKTDKPEYDTLSTLLQGGGGDPSSDAFMDSMDGDQSEDSGYGQDYEKGEKSNPMWDNLEDWWKNNL
jgi:hypothetical protein